MKTETHKIGDKDRVFKVSDSGTYYSDETPNEVINILESLRGTSQRIKMYVGDRVTGKDWMEESDKTGKIGRSTGPIKVPILLSTVDSTCGGAILDDCIVKIVTSPASTGRVLYKHPNYHQGEMIITEEGLPGNPEYTHTMRIDGEVYSRHTSFRSAQRLVARLK
jgi:hypothetical protein